jgi:hypothetical protein
MAIIPQTQLFSWTDVESKSDLDRFRMVLDTMPDESLMVCLETVRGKGRDDYPVRAVWNSVLAGIVFGHPSIESLRRELQRNGELRALCGFDSLKGSDAVPEPSAYTRFFRNLMRQQSELDRVFDNLVGCLAALLPDLGETLAADGKALPSFGNPTKKQDEDGRRDTDADWGVKTYKGERQDGSVFETTKRWFGYKLHLLIDSTYELPISFEVTKASVSDTTELLPLVEKAKEAHPEVMERAKELSADKGYDSTDNNSKLFDDHHVKPIIDIRNMWKDPDGPDDTRQLYPDRADNIVYDYKGGVFCICPVTDEKRDMVHYGFEEDRGTLKYRCPAAYYGLACQGRGQCGTLRSEYGRVVRIPLKLDRRIFTPVARSTQAWERKYDKRTAVERVNSRLDVSFGFELHTIRGLAKMRMRVSLALVVMLSMAAGSIRAGKSWRMRSLVWAVRPPKYKKAA